MTCHGGEGSAVVRSMDAELFSTYVPQTVGHLNSNKVIKRVGLMLFGCGQLEILGDERTRVLPPLLIGFR